MFSLYGKLEIVKLSFASVRFRVIGGSVVWRLGSTCCGLESEAHKDHISISHQGEYML